MKLSKDKAIKILSKYDNEFYTPATRQAHRMGVEALAKAVEVVRCKDCNYYKPQHKSAHWHNVTLYCCRSAAVKVKPDDFCSYGERKDDEKD